MSYYEAVNEHGERYLVPISKARQFARLKGVVDDHNWPRAVNPNVVEYQFCERWQGLHNVRFFERVGTDEWVVVWGQPKHNMAEFYQACCKLWPELEMGQPDPFKCPICLRSHLHSLDLRVRRFYVRYVDLLEQGPLLSADLVVAARPVEEAAGG